MAESILHDGDLDLANQYAHPDRSVTRRLDLGPQLMDPVGPNGERYARHEPLLSVLLLPGVASLGLWGAMATIALCGALAAGSVFALALDQGVSRGAVLRAWPLVALAPPFLFYSIRIWPEVPAALCFSEAVRAAGKRKYARMAAWLIGLSLLQLRFVAIAVLFAMLLVVFDRSARKLAIAAAAAVAIPLLTAWFAVGNPLNVHHWSEFAPAPAWKYARGGFGLLFDAQVGMLFQAPVWFAAVIGLGWYGFSVLRSQFSAGGRTVSPRRTGWVLAAAAVSAIPYLILLLPRDEWHGGWSPPLRYLVVFAPLVAVGGARLLEASRAWFAPAAIWTAFLALHGVAFPWRLFHIANGESVLGEWLSARWGSDFSRLLPSYIRPNGAAWGAAVLFVLAMIAAGVVRAARRGSGRDGRNEMPGAGAWEGPAGRPNRTGAALIVAVAIVLFFAVGVRRGNVVHFEDAHIDHPAGVLDPEIWTVGRFAHTGGWRLREGEALHFRMQPGRAVMYVRAEQGGIFQIDGRPHAMPATGTGFIEVPVEVNREKSTIRVIKGAMTFDRIERTR